MLLTWFSTSATPGEVVLRGRGLTGPRTWTSRPQAQPALAYTDAERQERIAGLEDGSWLHDDGDVYKHQVRLRGLQPDSVYSYAVTQDADTTRGTLRTAPTADDWRSLRLVAMSDSETEPRGRVTHREWAPGSVDPAGLPRPSAEPGGEWDTRVGTTTLSGERVLRYPLTEDEGFRHNLDVVAERRPDLVLMPGDLVQGGGYQPGWDEYFRLLAGTEGDLLSERPLVPAIGNWENYGALNGGYGAPADRSPVVRARDKYHAYIDTPSNGTAQHQDNYYRLDYGPLTILTLDSSNGEPDDAPSSYAPSAKLTGREYTGPGTDTQSNFTRSEYEAAGGTDLADFNPGSTQWTWVEAQLADARHDGRIVMVQFHHAPFSSGEHGLPMNHSQTSGQGGTPMRQYQPLFEAYGVAAVLSGHSEMFERSFVDEDGDGTGVHYYDVGVSGDGLRGERREAGPDSALLRYNPARVWTADQSEPERWEEADGVRQLVSGGKHYGHLEINVRRLREPGAAMEVTLQPVHVFPVLDSTYQVVRTERREYRDRVVLRLDEQGRVVG
jgi:hypothetical protein